MAQRMDRHELAMRYLLGDLSEEEETSLGKLFLSGEKEFEELEIAEGELIDHYVRRELSASESSQFEKILRKSPRLRERVEFAKILAKRVSSEPTPEPVPDPLPEVVPLKKKRRKLLPFGGFWGTTTGMTPALRFASAGIVVLMLIASVAFVVIWRQWQAEALRLAQEQQQQQQRQKELEEERIRNERNQGQEQQARREDEPQNNTNAELPKQPQQPRRQQRERQSVPAAIFLSPYRTSRSLGGAREPVENISAQARSVDVNLDVTGGDYPQYNASLSNDNNGLVIANQTDLKPFAARGGKYIKLEVPRSDLTDGRYSVRVEGVTASGQAQNFADYVFQVRIR